MSIIEPDPVELVVVPRTSDIGNFEVRRALPVREKRMVGPFVFWDQVGPGEFLRQQGLDVRPHPHIGLSTLTYLFDGSMDHKDSLGSDVRIHPGDVNLMTAGRGIVHSERTGPDVRQHPSRIFGIQSWVAQPKTHQQGEPHFVQHKQAELPHFDDAGVRGRVILGTFDGLTSPVLTEWDTLYVDVQMKAQTRVMIPKQTEERALYVVQGQVQIDQMAYGPERLLVLSPGRDIVVHAETEVRLMILGGATMDGPRYMWWNFVASEKAMIEDAAERWQNREFDDVPGDSEEYIPLPDMPRLADLKK